MLRRLFIVLIIIAISPRLLALIVADTAALVKDNSQNLRISLLTCGPGNDAWQTFGHCAIRIIDNSRDSVHRDITYNYGMINWQDGSIQQQFLRGRMRVFLDAIPFQPFITEYIEDGRYVTELELSLQENEKKRIQAYLENNALPENRYYTYNFLRDNCTIRIRDVFPKVLGPGFAFGRVIPDNVNFTFYDEYNIYMERKYWSALFSNIFLPKTNFKVSNEDVMFLPEFLDEGIYRATLNGVRIAKERKILTPGRVPILAQVDVPAIILFLIAIATLLGLSLPRFHALGKMMIWIVLSLSTLTGICILYTWFGTEYEVTKDNFNLLWAIPCNLVLPFLPARIKRIYALLGMVFILIAFLVHISGIQQFPLFELIPFWLALIAVYGYLYRRNI